MTEALTRQRSAPEIRPKFGFVCRKASIHWWKTVVVNIPVLASSIPHTAFQGTDRRHVLNDMPHWP